MRPSLLIRLRPLGPWRYGPAQGGYDRVDRLYRSDRLFSAVTLAMQRLGLLDEWLAATVHAEQPAVVLSSLFPFQGDVLFAIPPATLWPPPLALLNSPSPVFLTKIRWKSAQFVPLSVIDSLVSGQPILADQWLPDPESGCLLRRDRPSSTPFRVVTRSSAAVDRVNHISHDVASLACVEFEQGSGLWAVARFADSAQEQLWSPRVEAALRLLADSGLGGGRTKGWGQTQGVEFQRGSWPALLFPKVARLRGVSAESEDSSWWLLSLYAPAAADKINWKGGDYSLTSRSGRVESPAGNGSLKKTVRMVAEGCVLSAAAEPVGSAVDVAPDGFAHPVYRSGLALTLRLPVVELHPTEIAPAEVEATPETEPPEVATEAEQHKPAEPAPEPEPVAEHSPEPQAVDEPAPAEDHEHHTHQATEEPSDEL